jgi:hypothetical protein
VRVDYTGGVATITVNRSALSNTASFAFYVFTSQLDAAGEVLASDDAPDDSVLEYTLAPVSTKTYDSRRRASRPCGSTAARGRSSTHGSARCCTAR